MELDFISMIYYILENSQGIFLALKISVEYGYHIETMNEGNTKCLYITFIVFCKKLVIEKLSTTFSRLYHKTIKPIESYVAVDKKFNNPKTFILWHDRLGHLGVLNDMENHITRT